MFHLFLVLVYNDYLNLEIQVMRLNQKQLQLLLHSDMEERMLVAKTVNSDKVTDCRVVKNLCRKKIINYERNDKKKFIN